MAQKSKNKTANKMWGGHYSMAPSEIMQQINASIDFDRKLYRQDIAGSIAHAKMLAKQKIISKTDSSKIIKGLQQILNEINSGKFKFKTELEDIHMNIESRLREIIGDAAGRLHTARSRNDQVVTDFKLYVRDSIDNLISKTDILIKTLNIKVKENIDVIMPGFTHLQIAQPITMAHHLSAYVEMFKRDKSRLNDARERMNYCPLGSAALAGTSYNIDRNFTAKELGFKAPTSNSLDSVSSRDFALEYLNCLSILAVNLSRISEEIILWCSNGFRFISLSEKFTTGSSIMPQKRNPDAAEIVRAKVGRIFAALTNLTIVMKGLPLAYSKDMQEDKEPVFDATENILLCVQAVNGMIDDMKVNKANCLHFAKQGYSTATDLADWLVKNLNIPFRDAHHITGKCVKLAEEKGISLDEISMEEFQKIEKRITPEIFKVLSVENCADARTSFGGTSRKNYK
ncbi:MAG TPA: argininosuccinate lyase [Alphaproteobacteria bacterium]|nr:argininosuccinate lyase [Alphaproteobacteria bacterium]